MNFSTETLNNKTTLIIDFPKTHYRASRIAHIYYKEGEFYYSIYNSNGSILMELYSGHPCLRSAIDSAIYMVTDCNEEQAA